MQALVRQVFAEQYSIPGYRKVHADLVSRGVACSRETIRKCFKEAELRSRVGKRKFRPKTTDSNHKNPIADNVLNRDFVALKPNATWLADITYIEQQNGFCYLAAIVDMFSRRVVGWSVAEHMRASLVTDALKQAIIVRKGLPLDILFHSDRGVQFTSSEFRSVLEALGISQSMSRKGELVSHDTRYFVSSLDPNKVSAAEFLEIIVGRWEIENCLHLQKDRYFEEDKQVFRRSGLGAAWTVLTNLAVSLTRLLRGNERTLREVHEKCLANPTTTASRLGCKN